MLELSSFSLGDAFNPPVLLLHGLLGSKRNWVTIARDLAADFHVHALDLRNHGESPHSSEMMYDDLVGDVLAWMDGAALSEVNLIGHSMGGKSAMALACRFPERVRRLVVADIAPKVNPAMLKEFEAMDELDLDSLKSRAEAEEQMASKVPSLGMRRFLLTNLGRKQGGGFEWTVNVTGLMNALADIAGNPLEEGEFFEKPTLFIRGGASDFVRDEDFGVIREYFSDVQFQTFEGIGHNVHVDDRPRFVESVGDFLSA